MNGYEVLRKIVVALFLMFAITKTASAEGILHQENEDGLDGGSGRLYDILKRKLQPIEEALTSINERSSSKADTPNIELSVSDESSPRIEAKFNFIIKREEKTKKACRYDDLRSRLENINGDLIFGPGTIRDILEHRKRNDDSPEEGLQEDDQDPENANFDAVTKDETKAPVRQRDTKQQEDERERRAHARISKEEYDWYRQQLDQLYEALYSPQLENHAEDSAYMQFQNLQNNDGKLDENGESKAKETRDNAQAEAASTSEQRFDVYKSKNIPRSIKKRISKVIEVLYPSTVAKINESYSHGPPFKMTQEEIALYKQQLDRMFDTLYLGGYSGSKFKVAEKTDKYAKSRKRHGPRNAQDSGRSNDSSKSNNTAAVANTPATSKSNETSVSNKSSGQTFVPDELDSSQFFYKKPTAAENIAELLAKEDEARVSAVQDPNIGFPSNGQQFVFDNSPFSFSQPTEIEKIREIHAKEDDAIEDPHLDSYKSYLDRKYDNLYIRGNKDWASPPLNVYNLERLAAHGSTVGLRDNKWPKDLEKNKKRHSGKTSIWRHVEENTKKLRTINDEENPLIPNFQLKEPKYSKQTNSVDAVPEDPMDIYKTQLDRQYDNLYVSGTAGQIGRAQKELGDMKFDLKKFEDEFAANHRMNSMAGKDSSSETHEIRNHVPNFFRVVQQEADESQYLKSMPQDEMDTVQKGGPFAHEEKSLHDTSNALPFKYHMSPVAVKSLKQEITPGQQFQDDDVGREAHDPNAFGNKKFYTVLPPLLPSATENKAYNLANNLVRRQTPNRMDSDYPTVLTKTYDNSNMKSASLPASQNLLASVAQQMNTSTLELAQKLANMSDESIRNDPELTKILQHYVATTVVPSITKEPIKSDDKQPPVADISSAAIQHAPLVPPQIYRQQSGLVPALVGAQSDSSSSSVDELEGVLDKVLTRLERLRDEKVSSPAENTSKSNRKPEGGPCDIIGSWNSHEMGLRFDISLAKEGARELGEAEKNNTLLSIVLQECTPPKHHDILSTDWVLMGSAFKQTGGPFYMYTQRRSSGIVGTFAGFCRTCGGTDTIFGAWTFLYPSNDCQDIVASLQTKRDILRRDQMQTKQIERLKNTLFEQSKFARLMEQKNTS